MITKQMTNAKFESDPKLKGSGIQDDMSIEISSMGSYHQINDNDSPRNRVISVALSESALPVRMKKAPTITLTDPNDVEQMISTSEINPSVGPAGIMVISEHIPDLQRKYMESLKKKQQKPEKFGSDEDENFIAVNVYDKPEEMRSVRSIHS